MASVYDMIKQNNGQVKYRKDRKTFVGKDAVPAVVLEQLTEKNIVDENGLELVEDKGDFGKEELKELLAKKKDGNDNEDPAATEDKDDESLEDDDPSKSDEDDEEDDLDTDPDSSYPVTPSVPEANAQAIADTPAKQFKSKTPQSKPGMGFPRKNGKTVDIFDGVTPHTHVKSVGGHTVPLSAKSYREKTDSQIEARLKELGFDIVELDSYEQVKPRKSKKNDGDDEDFDGLSDDVI